MINSIKWHKQCYDNWLKHVNKQMDDLKRLQNYVLKNEIELNFYKKQIDEAVKRGKDSFDSSKFLIKLKDGK